MQSRLLDRFRSLRFRRKLVSQRLHRVRGLFAKILPCGSLYEGGMTSTSLPSCVRDDRSAVPSRIVGVGCGAIEEGCR